MKINNVSSSRVNFCRSEDTKKYLDKKLKTLDDPCFRKTLKDYVTFCDKVEKNLDNKEKKDDGLKTSCMMVDFVVGLKQHLLDTLGFCFPDYNKFAESEKLDYTLDKAHAPQESIWRDMLIGLEEKYTDPNYILTREEIMERRSDIEDKQLGAIYGFTPEYTDYGFDDDDFEDDIDGDFDDSAFKIKDKHTVDAPELLTFSEFSPNGLKDVKGMNALKAELSEGIIEPINNPEQAQLDFEEYGKKTPSAVLLYGPPGCGKTFIVEALAKEIDTPVYVMGTANIGSPYVNQTAKNIKSVFDGVKKEAKDKDKPVLLFMDEVETLVGERTSDSNSEDNKTVTTLLKEIEDARASNIIIIGATNKYDIVDPAIRRRFDMKRYVGLPEFSQREELISSNLSKKKKAKKLLEDENIISEISNKLDGYSYHSINLILDEAALNAYRRNRSDITYEDFLSALKNTNEEKIDERKYISEQKTKKQAVGFKD